MVSASLPFASLSFLRSGGVRSFVCKQELGRIGIMWRFRVRSFRQKIGCVIDSFISLCCR